MCNQKLPFTQDQIVKEADESAPGIVDAVWIESTDARSRMLIIEPPLPVRAYVRFGHEADRHGPPQPSEFQGGLSAKRGQLFCHALTSSSASKAQA
jgi:hypothetical protein